MSKNPDPHVVEVISGSQCRMGTGVIGKGSLYQVCDECVEFRQDFHGINHLRII